MAASFDPNKAAASSAGRWHPELGTQPTAEQLLQFVKDNVNLTPQVPMPRAAAEYFGAKKKGVGVG